MNLPIQHPDPVFLPARPWERLGLGGYNTVIREPNGTFRLWYGALFKTGLPSEGAFRLCYAESEDGLHWTVPSLGLVPFEGSTANNIVAPLLERQSQQGATVYRDDRAPAAERYKLWTKFRPTDDEMAQGVRAGLYAMYSDDGLRWHIYPGQPNPPQQQCDTQNMFFWDDSIEQYVGYTRTRETQQREEAATAGRGRYRAVGRLTSPDFHTWSATQIVLQADELDLNSPGPVARLPGEPVLDFYTSGAMKYPWAQHAYLMFPSVFYHWQGGNSQPALMDIQIMTSHDGIVWRREGNRQPFIRLGADGSIATGMLFANPWLIPVGDELWLYYMGTNRNHTDEGVGPIRSALFRATIRRDGFISMDAGYQGGELTTRAITFQGNRLEVNLDGSAGGWLRAELQDGMGHPLPGYTLADADVTSGNAIRKPLTWHGGQGGLADIVGPVKIRFVMRDMKLYAFQFTDKE